MSDRTCSIDGCERPVNVRSGRATKPDPMHYKPMCRVDHKAFDLARDTPTTDLVDNPRLAM